VTGPPLSLDFDACVAASTLATPVGGWVLVGANVWVVSEAGEKPLVLDLMVHHRTSMLGIRDGSHEDHRAYHHQIAVADLPPDRWSHVSIDLSRELRGAAERFGLEATWRQRTIRQVELVVEVHRAGAAARFAGLVLHHGSGYASGGTQPN